VFLRAGTPLTIDQVLLALADEGLDLERTQQVSARQRVSDVMRHQVRMGRAGDGVSDQGCSPREVAARPKMKNVSRWSSGSTRQS
jgi:hypothetical protein